MHEEGRSRRERPFSFACNVPNNHNAVLSEEG